MKLLGNIQDNEDIINKEYVKDMVISSDDSVNDVVTVTTAEFDAMILAGTVDPDTLYNVTDGPEQDKVVYNTVPVGTGVLWFGDLASVPTNFIVPDGSIVSISDYPDLFAIWGTKYGGNGTTTFGLPNLQGKVVVMTDTNDIDFDTVGEVGGEKSHQLKTNEMPVHTHTQASCSNPGNHQHLMYSGYVTYKGGSAPNANSPATGQADWGGDQYSGAAGGHTHTITLNDTGGDGYHNNLQPYIVAYYIIKAKKGVYTESLRRLDTEVAQMKSSLQVIETSITLEAGQVSTELEIDFPTGFSRQNCVIMSVMYTKVYATSYTEPPATVVWVPNYNSMDVITSALAVPTVYVTLSSTFHVQSDKIYAVWEVDTAPENDVKRFLRITLFKFR